MPCYKTHRVSRRSGFTLYEIVGVLVLLSVIALGVLSTLPNASSSLPAEIDRVSSHLRYAQIRAQADIYQWRLVFTSTTTYQVGPVVIPGAGFTPVNIPGTGATSATLSDGIATTSGTAVRFDSWGRPMSDAGALLATDQTITLTRGSESMTITIEAGTGLIP